VGSIPAGDIARKSSEELIYFISDLSHAPQETSKMTFGRAKPSTSRLMHRTPSLMLPSKRYGYCASARPPAKRSSSRKPAYAWPRGPRRRPRSTRPPRPKPKRRPRPLPPSTGRSLCSQPNRPRDCLWEESSPQNARRVGLFPSGV
jgi:hypothetical protein